jgi:hypothetical protein
MVIVNNFTTLHQSSGAQLFYQLGKNLKEMISAGIKKKTFLTKRNSEFKTSNFC